MIEVSEIVKRYLKNQVGLVSSVNFKTFPNC